MLSAWLNNIDPDQTHQVQHWLFVTYPADFDHFNKQNRNWTCSTFRTLIVGVVVSDYLRETGHRILSKYWDILSSYHTCPKIWNSLFYYPLICLKWCWMGGKQCRSWSDAALAASDLGLRCLQMPVYLYLGLLGIPHNEM